MALNLTGIENVEFYSGHYLDSVLEGDVKGLFDAWKKAADEHGTKPPFERLTGPATAWEKARRAASGEPDAVDRWSAARGFHAELLEADFQNAKAAGEIPADHPGDNEVEMQDVYAEMFYEAERLGLTRVAEAREREANLWGGGPNIDVCDSFLIQPRSKEDDSLVQRSDLPSEQWFFDEDDPDGNLLPTPALRGRAGRGQARRERRGTTLRFYKHLRRQ